MDNNFNLSPYEQKYVDIINKLKETFFKKNHDYGSSVKKNYDKFESYGKNEGLKYVFGRIAEKHDRLENLIYGDHTNQVIDESLMDTLLDMANYAILAAVSLDEHKTPDLKELQNLASIKCIEKPYSQNKDILRTGNLKNDFYKGDNPPYYGG